MYVKFNLFFLSLLLFLSCSKSDNCADLYRLTAAKEFQKEADFFNINFDTTFKYTLLDDTLDSPFEKTDFLLYRFSKIEPNSSVITYELNDRIYFLSNSIDSVANELNILLFKEDTLSDQGLLELAKFISKIQSPIHNMVYLINSWKDIPLKENEKFPDSLKSEIMPPRVVQKNDNKIVEFYNWYACSAELNKIVITYLNKEISIKEEKIINIGPIYIIL